MTEAFKEAEVHEILQDLNMAKDPESFRKSKESEKAELSIWRGEEWDWWRIRQGSRVRERDETNEGWEE